jgi:hypothetical protein
MRGTSLLGLVLALAITVALFGGAYLAVEVIMPALARGQGMEMLRWLAVAVIGGILAYRLFKRFRRRRRAEDDA